MERKLAELDQDPGAVPADPPHQTLNLLFHRIWTGWANNQAYGAAGRGELWFQMMCEFERLQIVRSDIKYAEIFDTLDALARLDQKETDYCSEVRALWHKVANQLARAGFHV